MPLTLKREKLNANVVAFPATKTAAATSIWSDVIKDFYSSGMSAAEVYLSVFDSTKITANTLTMNSYVSWDGGATWSKVNTSTELAQNAGTKEITSFVITQATRSNYNGKWFGLYVGTTPYLFWFDHTGSASRPTTGNSVFDNATAFKVGVGAADVDDTIGAAMEVDIDANAAGVFTSTYTAGTNTMAITAVRPCACLSANAGNMMTGTAAVSSIGVTTQGVDPVYQKLIPFAPQVKVEAAFDGSATLGSGHGCKVNVVMREYDVDLRKKVYPACVTLPASSVAGEYREWVSSTMYVDTLDVLKKFAVNFYCADLSKVTNDVSYALETSDDNVTWRLAAAAITNFDNGSGIYNVFTEATTGATYKLGKYARVRIYCDNLGLIASGHGIVVTGVVCY